MFHYLSTYYLFLSALPKEVINSSSLLDKTESGL
ncbi:hypothetical protein ECH_0271 [Ehrlichia chaffeensis str. Arkansas]|uniref:Uncharacterized protein n=1 Tax=Ehrlichia chaffeensis (strain ATCC CRL-10679 / Arkansas) TaxID=205920 RepID=Q2GHJ1_EHRCR|nr:hypothetical protein ECH_0271 [Ehrlichia chaffeensis str. Arkansas]